MQIGKHVADLVEFAKLKENLRAGKTPCSIFGVAQSLKPHFAASVSRETKRPVIVVCASPERAESYAAASEQAVHIPKRALQLRSSIARSREAEFVRISAIAKLLSGQASVAFLCEEALCARLVPKSDFMQASRHIKKDDVIDPEALLRSLVLGGYERVSSVETQGQAARRGEVVDVFCPGKVAPYRIDFFDDIVESIHEFDQSTQRRSKSAADEAELLPAVEMVLSEDTASRLAHYFDAAKPADSALAVRFEEYGESVQNDKFFEDIDNFTYAFCEDSLIEYLDEPIVIFDDYKHVKTTADERSADFDTKLYELIGSREAVADQRDLYLPMEEMLSRAKKTSVLDYCGISKSRDVGAKSEINVHSSSALSYNKHMELLRGDIATRISNGWSVYLVCGSMAKAEKLSAALSDGELSVPYTERDLVHGQAGTFAQRLLSGFELTTQKTYFLGENEIYGFAKKRKRAPVRKPLDIFTDLKTGDMIVHDVHGKG